MLQHEKPLSYGSPSFSKSQVSTKLCKTKQFAKNVADAGVFLVGLLLVSGGNFGIQCVPDLFCQLRSRKIIGTEKIRVFIFI